MIGVFDSGFGGLTILKSLLENLPQYSYTYLGDSARAPYGNKSQEVIYSYAKEAVDFLFTQGCELIVFACNTASAEALERIKLEYLPKKWPGKKVFGVIVPIADYVSDFQQKRIGLIATRATIESNSYEKEIKKKNKQVEIIQQPCPLLVPLIEEGWIKKSETKRILRSYLKPLKNKKINYLILGCTHYPLLYDQVVKIMGKKVKVINPPKIISTALKKFIDHDETLVVLLENKKTERIYYTTDDPQKFSKLGKKFLGANILTVKKANI